MPQTVVLRSAALVAALALLAGPSRAAISPGTTQSAGNAAYSGNGELFLSVFDPVAKLSYTKDLGVTQNDFFVTGQQDAGYQNFWTVDTTDPYWASFLSQVTVANLRWSVLALDQTGGTAVGGVRLFTTLQQGDETKLIDLSLLQPGATTGLSTMTNQLFSLGMGSTQAGTFFNALNTTGSHGTSGQPLDFSVNGSSVNADSDPGNAYYGYGPGLSATLNGNAPFDLSNPVGKSSWYYYLTRSSTNQLDYVQVDEFDNLGADGYWGFIYVDPSLDPTSPFVGQWALSYTLAAVQTAQTLAFAAQIGRTEYDGAFSVRNLDGVAAAAAGEAAAGWSTRLGGLTSPAAPVPELPAALQLAAGLLALAAARRRFA